MSMLRALWLLCGVFFISTTLLSAQSQYRYSYMPKRVFVNQLFPITVMAISESRADKPHFTFDTKSPIQPLSKEPLVIKNGDDSFYTFYFKASNVDVNIPRLFISTSDSSLEPQLIPLVPLKPREDFCGVLAADMKIKTSQVSHYDGDNHMVTLSIEAYEANLEDMYLKNLQEYGVERLERNNPKVQAEFYAVLPISQKVLKFTYFNTIKQQYIFLEVPVELVESSVSTQSELNPKEDSFEKLKKYTLIALVTFFFIMFLWRRDFFYLVLGVVSLITLLTLFIPHKKICVKQGAPLYILPTQTSTIGTKVDQKFETMLLGQHGAFWKVEYKQGIIGWIRDEDLCEN